MGAGTRWLRPRASAVKAYGFTRTLASHEREVLRGTLIALVTKSTAGMTAEHLGETLRCRCHSVLVKLVRQDRLQKQKRERAYVYLAADDRTASRQFQATEKAEAVLLPAEISVLVLTEHIRNPGGGFANLAKTIAKHTGMRIKAGQIKTLFHQHGIKKTA